MRTKRPCTITLETNRFSSDLPSRQFFAKVSPDKSTPDQAPGGRWAKVTKVDGEQMEIEILSSLGEDESVLVHLTRADRLDLLARFPGLQIVEDGVARLALFQPEIEQDGATLAANTLLSKITVSVRGTDGKPVVDSKVYAVTARDPMRGAQGTTNAEGKVDLVLARRPLYLIAEPTHTYWPSVLIEPAIADGLQFDLTCPLIAEHRDDSVKHFYGGAQPGGQAKIVVAVIDGGIGPHAALNISGGKSVVAGEDPSDWSDNGVGHGTHVAGLIRRLAPHCEIFAIRAFRKDQVTTDGFFIAAAVREAVSAGADIINLSLTFDNDQPALLEQIQRALAMGVVCVAAAGNAGGRVLVPAKHSEVVAVSAIGRRGSWPGNALDPYLKAPASTHDPELCSATFTCSGPEISVSGPGVGIVSTYPGERYAVMNGTSMAAPVVTGLLARYLAADPVFAALPRDARRGEHMRQVLYSQARLMGLDPTALEGHGLAFSN